MAYRQRLLTLLAVAGLVVAACSSGASPSAAPSSEATPAATAEVTPAPTEAAVESYPRNETLYTTGKQWGPPSTWNPLDPNAAMGVVGLQYETLFLFDPLADTFEPWLAESAEWTDPDDVHDQDPRGRDLGRRHAVHGRRRRLHDRPRQDQGRRVEHLGLRLRCHRDRRLDGRRQVQRPGVPAVGAWTYNSPIVPKHIWESKANEDILKDTNANGVGTGPYMYKTHGRGPDGLGAKRLLVGQEASASRSSPSTSSTSSTGRTTSPSAG